MFGSTCPACGVWKTKDGTSDGGNGELGRTYEGKGCMPYCMTCTLVGDSWVIKGDSEPAIKVQKDAKPISVSLDTTTRGNKEIVLDKCLVFHVQNVVDDL